MKKFMFEVLNCLFLVLKAIFGSRSERKIEKQIHDDEEHQDDDSM